MPHLPSMIEDLALILGIAAIVTLIFRKLKQPAVLGYLVAGFLVGPHTSLFGGLVAAENVKLWGDLGVIFLLFALGLEFSFKKLLRVGGSASITAFFEISMMLALGFLTGHLMGWNTMDSLFLGGIISISSTSIIVRTLEELGLKNKKFVGLVMGVLVIEDLVAILLMVLLSTVALTRQFSGAEMLVSISKLGFFLAIWFTAGMFLLPSFFRRAQRLLSEESLLVMAVGLCLVMVVFANYVGFSSALGAFVTGSLLAETIEGERIHHLVRPVRDLFSAVFFISVGMLINPLAIAAHGSAVFVITLVVIFGKMISVGLGSLLAGQSLKHSVQTGMTLAQIGEFSFIIATVGLSFGVISEDLYPIAVAVSVTTAFTTPYLIQSGESFFSRMEKILPAKWVIHLYNYERISFALAADRQWRALLKSYVTKILLNAVLAAGLFLLIMRFGFPWSAQGQLGEEAAKPLCLALSLLLISPFLWAVAFGRTQNAELLNFLDAHNVVKRSRLFTGLRILLAAFLLGAMLVQFVSWIWAAVVTLGTIAAVGIFMYPFLDRMYHWFESRFLGNFNDEISPRQPFQIRRALAPWDAHITEFEVPQEAPYVGQPLHALGIREKYGVTIAMIERGRLRLLAPGRDEVLMPYDGVFVIGNDEQLMSFKFFIESASHSMGGLDEDDIFTLEKCEISAESRFAHKNIRESGLREITRGLVVGIERRGKRILNPDSSTVLEAGDLLWIVGDRGRILSLE